MANPDHTAGKLVRSDDGKSLATTSAKTARKLPHLQDGIALRIAGSGAVAANPLDEKPNRSGKDNIKRRRLGYLFSAPVLHDGALRSQRQSNLRVLTATDGKLVYEIEAGREARSTQAPASGGNPSF